MGFRLLPRDDKFFVLFNDTAANVADCALRLQQLIGNDGAQLDNGAQLDDVVVCEQRGDQLTREILQRLNTSFVTPFDREDIHALAEKLDDVVDDMLEVAYRLDLRELDIEAIPELKQQADLLVEMAGEVVELVRRLKSMKGVRPHLDTIDRLESAGDMLYRQALRRLYSDDFKARATLYWKDVVEAMEDALDTIEDISDVVEAIVLKHA